jgi:hypothetical protein
MKLIMRLLEKIVVWSIRPMVRNTIKNFTDAPLHCGHQMEFIGEHTSLFGKQRIYQCEVCKKVDTL